MGPMGWVRKRFWGERGVGQYSMGSRLGSQMGADLNVALGILNSYILLFHLGIVTVVAYVFVYKVLTVFSCQ